MAQLDPPRGQQVHTAAPRWQLWPDCGPWVPWHDWLARLVQAGGAADGPLLQWLHDLRREVLQVLRRRAPKMPVPADTEALVGDATADPWSALVIDVCVACEEALAPGDFAQALALSGSWPTAQALFRHAGFHFGEDAIDYGPVLGILADRALWKESCTLLLEMRFRSMNPFAGTCALAAVACYKAAQYQAAEQQRPGTFNRRPSGDVGFILLWCVMSFAQQLGQKALKYQVACRDQWVEKIQQDFKRHCDEEAKWGHCSAQMRARTPEFQKGQHKFLATATLAESAGLWQEALVFLEDMRRRRVDPDAYAYNNVMAASRKVSDFSVAPLLLQSMRQEQVQADAWSYSQAMDASNAMGTWERSLGYLRRAGHTRRAGVHCGHHGLRRGQCLGRVNSLGG
eukprot:Skav224350  [mRNA]  locus=scaffold2411:227554:240331:- [translate_table: standard]